MYFYDRYEYDEYQEEYRKVSEDVDRIFCEFSRKNEIGFIKLFNEIMFMSGNYDDIIHEGKVRQVVDKVKIANRRVDRKVDGTLDPIIKGIKTNIIGQTREEIMSNHVKVSKLIRRVLLEGAIFYINPTIGILKLFITSLLRGRLKTREREKILADLKRELAICEEKIRDADASGDKNKKYKLMRLKNELERSIERVRSPRLNKA